VVGLWNQVGLAKANLSARESDRLHYPTLQASRWLRDSTPKDTVVMSFNPWLTHAVSERYVVPFPPTASAQAIMRIAAKYRSRYLVVFHDDWYTPSQEERLQVLLAAYPSSLIPRVVRQRYRIYEFLQPAGASASDRQ
jgi:hypothetical protein